MNRTLGDLLRLNVPNTQAEWDLNLGLVLMASPSSVLDSSGFTPHILLFGKEMRIPIEIMYGDPVPRRATRNELVSDVRAKLALAYDLVREHLKIAQK